MLPLQITVRDILPTGPIENKIRERAKKLGQIYKQINSCRVVIDMPQKHKHQGKLFNVHIDLTIPKKELAVTHQENKDLYLAIRDAFNATERLLEKYVKSKNVRKKGAIKRDFNFPVEIT